MAMVGIYKFEDAADAFDIAAQEEFGVLACECSICKRVGVYSLSEKESEALTLYDVFGRQMGAIQDVFPDVPAWIRSGAIDQYSGGFCICPDCCDR